MAEETNFVVEAAEGGVNLVAMDEDVTVYTLSAEDAVILAAHLFDAAEEIK